MEYWFQDVEGDGYTRNEGLDETRYATTGETATAVTKEGEYLETANDGKVNYDGKYNDKTIADESLIGAEDYEAQNAFMASPFYGFNYAKCDPIEEVAADGSSVLRLYYDREEWTVKIHSTPVYLRYKLLQ